MNFDEHLSVIYFIFWPAPNVQDLAMVLSTMPSNHQSFRCQ